MCDGFADSAATLFYGLCVPPDLVFPAVRSPALRRRSMFFFLYRQNLHTPVQHMNSYGEADGNYFQRHSNDSSTDSFAVLIPLVIPIFPLSITISSGPIRARLSQGLPGELHKPGDPKVKFYHSSFKCPTSV